MDLQTAIKYRKSVRAFTGSPVSSKVLKEVINLALASPSWGNTQPWEVYIVFGEKLVKIKEEVTKKYMRGDQPSPDLPLPTSWPTPCLKRYKKLGKALFEHIGITRSDEDSRRSHYLKMFQGFGAPVFVYICLDKKLSNYALIDVGLFIQSLCLAAVLKGLGSCILTHLVLYPNVVRAALEIANTKNVVMGVALGYEDKSARINHFKSGRESEAVLVKSFS